MAAKRGMGEGMETPGVIECMEKIEENMRLMAAAENPPEAIKASWQVHQYTYKMLKAVGRLTEAKGNQQQGKKDSLAESRSIANLKTLGSDRTEFRQWNERLINAVTQAMGIPWRSFMKKVMESLDVNRKLLTNEEVEKEAEMAEIENIEGAAENLYYVLVEKTEGDAALRVSSVEPGEGMQAYMKVYLWFAGTTGLALTEISRMVMQPVPPKNDFEIADALEKWMEQERRVRALPARLSEY